MKNSHLLTTRLLDEKSRIGPFFFQEFVLLLLMLLSSALLVVVLSLFMEVPGFAIVLVPAGMLLLVGLLRMAFKGQVTSPWYLHHWVARRFVRPTHLKPSIKPFICSLGYLSIESLNKSLNKKITR